MTYTLCYTHRYWVLQHANTAADDHDPGESLIQVADPEYPAKLFELPRTQLIFTPPLSPLSLASSPLSPGLSRPLFLS